MGCKGRAETYATLQIGDNGEVGLTQSLAWRLLGECLHGCSDRNADAYEGRKLLAEVDDDLRLGFWGLELEKLDEPVEITGLYRGGRCDVLHLCSCLSDHVDGPHHLGDGGSAGVDEVARRLLQGPHSRGLCPMPKL